MAMTVLRNNLTTLALSAFDKSVSMIGKALARVANGQKVVSAADDASQYAISERMRNMIRDLNQSSENIQNDSTMLKIAEGAVGSTISIVRNMKEKAVQASDINMTDEERNALQKELDALIDQVSDNARVEFNGKKLLDGASSPLYSNSYSKKELVARGLNSAWIRDSLNLAEQTYGLSFLSNTARIRQMEVFIDDESSGDSPVTASISTNKPNTIELHVNANYFDENYLRNPNGVSTEENGLYFDRQIARGLTQAVLLSNIENFENLDENIRDGMLSVIDGSDDEGDGTEALSNTGFVMMRYMAYQSYRPTDEFVKEFARCLAEEWAYNGNLDSTIAQATGGAIRSFNELSSGVESILGNEDALREEAGIIVDNEDIGSLTGSDMGRGATKNARTSVREVSNPANWRLPSKPNTFVNGLEITWQKDYLATADSGGGFNFQIGATVNDKMSVGLFNMSAYGLGLIDDNGQRLQITTQGNAKEAVNVLERLVVTLLEHEADIGAIHQRVQFTTGNLEKSSDNIQAAESIIRDADMAKEMVELNRGRALNQASQSVLAQANQNSEKVLQVLSNESAPIEVHANTIQAKHVFDENLSEVGKDLKQISSGEKVVDPTDGSSSYQIGESMRVKLRALEQDNQNVQNGSAILKVAQGTTEAIVKDLTALKEIAVNAANGYNNDVDRRILQKNFEQLRDKINELATQTTYNDHQLVDGRYQRYHTVFDSESNRAVINEAIGLTIQHGTEAGQSVRFYINDMHSGSLGGSNVGKDDLDHLLNNREFINSRNDAELETLTVLQGQLQQLREDSSVLKRDESLRERLQGLITDFSDEGQDEESDVNIRHAVMREYLDIETLGEDQVVENLNRYEFLKPMLEEELVVDGLKTRLNEAGEEIEVDESDEETATKDIEAVEVLKDAAGKTLSDAKLETIHDANVAMHIVSSALNTALDSAAQLGAYLSRLEFTSQNISSQIENTENMNSTIRDADMAKSMSKYMKDQMAMRASQTMLSQAIHDPTMVLTFTQ